MRLISQDGTYDFPYERVVVYRNETSVVCGIMPDIREKVLLGKYSSKSKALNVMEMLREQYFDNKHEETYRDGACSYAPNFKFPDDSEVEV